MNKLIKYYFLILGCVLMPNMALAQISPAELQENFVMAGSMYKEGKYAEAITKYQEILLGDKESGPIYYNLGNAHFKNGELGKALLNYSRAQRLIPRDSDLNYNYNYALSQVEQYGAKTKPGFLDRAIDGHIQFYSLDEMTMIIVGFCILFGLIFLLALYLKWSKKLSNALYIGIGIVLIVFVTGLILKVQKEANQAILMAATSSNFEPRENSTTHFKLSEGTQVQIIKKEDNWVKIKRGDGKLGWIRKDKLEEI